MIELSSTETTTIGFKINIEGNTETPTSRFVLKISDDIFLMFPAKVMEDKAVVNVPALSFLSAFKESELESYLEVFVNGSFFVPWQGSSILKTPVNIKASLEPSSEVNFKDKERVKTTIMSAEVDGVSFESKKEDNKPLDEGKTQKSKSFSEFIKEKGLR